VKNAGKEPTSVIEEIQRSGFGMGFDAKTGQVCDLQERGVVDPTVNALAILQTSISTIHAMLNLSSLIHIENDSMEEQDEDRMFAAGRMGSSGRRGRNI
jgi:chaperonin GroEL (HSP60 family)